MAMNIELYETPKGKRPAIAPVVFDRVRINGEPVYTEVDAPIIIRGDESSVTTVTMTIIVDSLKVYSVYEGEDNN